MALNLFAFKEIRVEWCNLLLCLFWRGFGRDLALLAQQLKALYCTRKFA